MQNIGAKAYHKQKVIKPAKMNKTSTIGANNT